MHTDFPEVLIKLVNYLYCKDITAETEISVLEALSKERVDLLTNESDVIILHGFSDFKNPETLLLQAFSKSKTPVAMYIDYDPTNGPLFGNIEKHIISFTDSNFRLHLFSNDLDVEARTNNELLTKDKLPLSQYLRRNLFSSRNRFENDDLKRIVKVIAVQSRQEEVNVIASLVRHLAETGIKLSDIAITPGDPTKYSSMFRDTFRDAAIPANITDRFELSSSAVAASVFSVLSVIQQGFRSDDVFRMLRSNYLKFLIYSNKEDSNNKQINAEIKQKEDSYNLLNYQDIAEESIGANNIKLDISTRAEIEIDRNNLIRVLDTIRAAKHLTGRDSSFLVKLIENYYNRLNNELIKFPSDGNDYEKRKLEHEINGSGKALEDLKLLVKMINIPSKKYLPSEFAYIVKERIFTSLRIKDCILDGFYEKLKSTGEGSEREFLIERTERDGRAFTELVSILDEMCFILSERMPGQSFELTELIERYRATVLGAKYQLREKQGYGVEITSIEQTRGFDYKVIISCGLCDGELPMNYQPERFLGKELPETEKQQQKSEKYRFYQLLSNAPNLLDKGDKQIFLFYPKYEDNRELIPSHFLDALKNIVSQKYDEYVYDSLKLREIVNKSDDACSEQELTLKNQFKWLNTLITPRQVQAKFSKFIVNSLKIDGKASQEELLEKAANYFTAASPPQF